MDRRLDWPGCEGSPETQPSALPGKHELMSLTPTVVAHTEDVVPTINSINSVVSSRAATPSSLSGENEQELFLHVPTDMSGKETPVQDVGFTSSNTHPSIMVTLPSGDESQGWQPPGRRSSNSGPTAVARSVSQRSFTSIMSAPGASTTLPARSKDMEETIREVVNRTTKDTAHLTSLGSLRPLRSSEMPQGPVGRRMSLSSAGPLTALGVPGDLAALSGRGAGPHSERLNSVLVPRAASPRGDAHPRRASFLISPGSSTVVSLQAPGASVHSQRLTALQERGTTMGAFTPVLSGFREEPQADFDKRVSWKQPYRSSVHRLFEARTALQPHCRYIIKTKLFQVGMLSSLFFALFLPDLWIVMDRSNNHDLDVILTFVLALFLFEVVVQSIAFTRTYWGTFFFWMDLLGATSVLLDLSYFPLLALVQGNFSDNVIIMRAARIAKLGARAGRFTKLVKLLRFLPGMQVAHDDYGTARVISAKLVTALSTRISCLIIVMVMIMPVFSMFSFPDNDWSLFSWLTILEDIGLRYPERLEDYIDEFQRFYIEMKYSPYYLVATFPTLQIKKEFHIPRGVPRRKWNSVTLETEHVKCDFNFTVPNKMDSLMSMLLIVWVIALMVIFSLLLSNSVSGLVMRPLEKLLAQVKNAADTIFQSVNDMTNFMEDEEGIQGEESLEEDLDDQADLGFDTETLLLERVVDKLSILGTLIVKKGIDEEAVAEMDATDRGIFDHFNGAAPLTKWPSDLEKEDNMDSLEDMNLLEAQRAMISGAGLSIDLIDSWDLNPLELDRVRCHAACVYFLGPHNHGVKFDPLVMSNFLKTAEAGYRAVPYHNWFHAVDVTHTVYRLYQSWSCDAYLSGNERYAMLVAATCHDLGHDGFNNAFLIETAHELALRYNDKSPLENMHCARLFEIAGEPRNNVFSELTKQDYQEARHTCTEVILHTDAARHFEMIKDTQLFYEVHSDLLSVGFKSYAQRPQAFPIKEVSDFFRQPECRSLIRKLLLHLADISNPTKPFRICRVWAWKICEEFFLQGDNEKALGMPVQSLNDREKTNKPFSQVGFIEFLVAPLAFAVLKVIPPYEVCLEQMIENLKRWREMWVAETKPEPSKDDQKALDARIDKLERRFLDEVVVPVK